MEEGLRDYFLAFDMDLYLLPNKAGNHKPKESKPLK